MITKKKLTKTFAIFSIVIVVIHFLLEALYTIEFGQHWTGIIPDYIVVCLMFLGGISALKNIKIVAYYVAHGSLLFVYNTEHGRGDTMKHH